MEAKAAPSADYADIASLFRKAAEALPETDPRRRYVSWEIQVHDYHLSHDQADKGLLPMMVMGGRAYPASVEEVPEDAVEYFKERLASSRQSSTRARLADFLWLRTKRFPFAEQAITTYLQAVPEILPSTRGRSMACEYLGRAAHLVLSLRRDATPLLAAIRSLAERFLTDEDGHLVGLLMATQDAIDRDGSLGSWLVDEAKILAGKKAPGQSRIFERSLLEALLPLSTVRRDPQQARAIRLRIARSFEIEAQEREGDGALVQSVLLQKAIRAYQDLGLGEDVDRLKPLIHQATKKTEEGLHRVSTGFTVEDAQFQRQVDTYLDAGRKHTPFAHLLIFVRYQGLWPKWPEISALVADINRQAPLQALVNKVTITPDGRPFERPADPDKRREFDEIEWYVRTLWVSLKLAARVHDIFRERQAWSEELLVQAFAHGTLFEAEALDCVRPGIAAFEEGRYWESLHVLVPQIERLIRILARRVDAQTYRYVSETGEIHWSSLDSLLDEPRVAEVLGKVAPDLARELKYVLADSRGMNLRNDVCHAILTHGADAAGLSFLCIMILLTLANLTVGPPPPDPPVGSAGTTGGDQTP